MRLNKRRIPNMSFGYPSKSWKIRESPILGYDLKKGIQLSHRNRWDLPYFAKGCLWVVAYTKMKYWLLSYSGCKQGYPWSHSPMWSSAGTYPSCVRTPKFFTPHCPLLQPSFHHVSIYHNLLPPAIVGSQLLFFCCDKNTLQKLLRKGLF